MTEPRPQGGPAPAPAASGRNRQVTRPGSAADGREARIPYAGPGGFLLLDKPAGISSFQALRPAKRAFHKAKVGHAGTLDPAASGLLIAGIAAGTRLLGYLEGMPKTYAFTAHFGFVSDTYDREGRIEPHAGARPAAALTAYSRVEDARQAIESGFQRHVSKPVEPDNLVAQVAALAGRQEAAAPDKPFAG